MLALIVCWILFPALLGLLAWGAGGLVQAMTGRPLVTAVRVPCGLALLMAALDLCTRTTATAPLAVPLATALGVAGLILSPPRPSRQIDEAIWAAGVTFAVFAAPVVLSGAATWTGYIKLDDTATWLAFVDHTLIHGRSLDGIAPSTYEAVIALNVVVGYPVGAFLPLGFGKLLGQDIAWLANPWMATMAGALAMSLQHAARTALRHAPRWIPIAIAALAAQSALLYGYYLWGGIKEVASGFLIAAFAGAATLVAESPRRMRSVIPAVIVLWALVDSLTLGGLVWAVPGAILALVLLVRRRPPLPSRRTLAIAAAVLVVAAVALQGAARYAVSFGHALSDKSVVGNLVGPLGLQQIAGIWPSGDFRIAPQELTLTHVLIALVVIGALGGLVLAISNRSTELVLYVSCALVGALAFYNLTSPWLAGKALATASPALPLAALTAAGWIVSRHASEGNRFWHAGHDRWLRVAAAVGASAIAAGILWSTLFQYHDASLGPRQQYAELADIGEHISGYGPTLMTEYSPWGARHFLRSAAPESASELRTRFIPLTNGGQVPKGAGADIDQFSLSAVMTYPTIVLQRSPVGSRPPSPYRLLRNLRFWQEWQRPLQVNPPVIAHLPLGDVIHPGAVPNCGAVLNMASAAGVVSLAAAPVENPVVAAVSQGDHPPRWSLGNSFLSLVGAGSAHIPVTVPHGGRFQAWLGGSMRGPVSLSVDGHAAGSARNEIQESGQYVPFGDIALTPGAHTVTLRYAPGWLPGSGGPPDTVGPLVLAATTPPGPLLSVPASGARSLCGRNLDWVESLGA